MPFLPDAWRPPLHHIYHPIGEARKYKEEATGRTFKVLRGSRENGRAEVEVKNLQNNRTTVWCADVIFGEDGFVYKKDWTTERILNQDGSIWKIIGHPTVRQQHRVLYDGEWRGQR